MNETPRRESPDERLLRLLTERIERKLLVSEDSTSSVAQEIAKDVTDALHEIGLMVIEASEVRHEELRLIGGKLADVARNGSRQYMGHMAAHVTRLTWSGPWIPSDPPSELALGMPQAHVEVHDDQSYCAACKVMKELYTNGPEER